MLRKPFKLLLLANKQRTYSTLAMILLRMGSLLDSQLHKFFHQHPLLRISCQALRQIR